MAPLEDFVTNGGRPNVPRETPVYYAKLVRLLSIASLCRLMLSLRQINACWQQDPLSRPSFEQICALIKAMASRLAPGLVLHDDDADARAFSQRQSTQRRQSSTAGAAAVVQGEILRQIVPDPPMELDCLVAVTSTRQVWGGCKDSTIVVWSADTGDQMTRFSSGHDGAINALANIGGQVWTGGADGTLRVWHASATPATPLKSMSGLLNKKAASGPLWNRRFCQLDQVSQVFNICVAFVHVYTVF